jgi:hypothetical protein
MQALETDLMNSELMNQRISNLNFVLSSNFSHNIDPGTVMYKCEKTTNKE